MIELNLNYGAGVAAAAQQALFSGTLSEAPASRISPPTTISPASCSTSQLEAIVSADAAAGDCRSGRSTHLARLPRSPPIDRPGQPSRHVPRSDVRELR